MVGLFVFIGNRRARARESRDQPDRCRKRQLGRYARSPWSRSPAPTACPKKADIKRTSLMVRQMDWIALNGEPGLFLDHRDLAADLVRCLGGLGRCPAPSPPGDDGKAPARPRRRGPLRSLHSAPTGWSGWQCLMINTITSPNSLRRNGKAFDSFVPGAVRSSRPGPMIRQVITSPGQFISCNRRGKAPRQPRQRSGRSPEFLLKPRPLRSD